MNRNEISRWEIRSGTGRYQFSLPISGGTIKTLRRRLNKIERSTGGNRRDLASQLLHAEGFLPRSTNADRHNAINALLAPRIRMISSKSAAPKADPARNDMEAEYRAAAMAEQEFEMRAAFGPGTRLGNERPIAGRGATRRGIPG